MTDSSHTTDQGHVTRALEKSGEQLKKALIGFVDNGAGPVTGARPYAEARLETFPDPEVAIRRIIRETVAAAGATGFATGVGGFVTMPITVPANLAGNAMLNARMVAGIAHLRGWDIKDEAVQQLILMVIAGESAMGAMRAIGIKTAQEFTKQAIKKVPAETIRAINKRVGFMLIAKYGTKKSAVTLVKIVPFVGGVVGGTVDASFTRSIGGVAKKVFPAQNGTAIPF